MKLIDKLKAFYDYEKAYMGASINFMIKIYKNRLFDKRYMTKEELHFDQMGYNYFRGDDNVENYFELIRRTSNIADELSARQAEIGKL